jgi:hypothetical protein
MSAIPQSVSHQDDQSSATATSVNAPFLKFLPAVTTHASIKFRHMNHADREEAIAEATAAAFLNLHRATCNGRAHRIKSSTLAHYAVLHVKSGKHVGGSADSQTDVMSPRAQRRGGFRVLGLPWNDRRVDCLRSTDAEVWRLQLRHDRRTPPPDQAAFRIDLSNFLVRQHDRTRQILALLAAGHQQTEVADRMGVTPSAVNQRVKRAGREWAQMQGEVATNGSRDNAQA